MSFENIILILQTVGPFTVLVTVYFLVTELKEQNRVARANARQNIADSHQKVALAGMKPILVDIENNSPLIAIDKIKNKISQKTVCAIPHFTSNVNKTLVPRHSDL